MLPINTNGPGKHVLVFLVDPRLLCHAKPHASPANWLFAARFCKTLLLANPRPLTVFITETKN